MNIFLVRATDYPDSHCEKIAGFLNDFWGPAKFTYSDYPYSFRQEKFIDDLRGYITLPQNYTSSYLKKRIKNWNEDVFTDELPLGRLFEVCNKFRNLKALSPDDFVLLLVKSPNSINWFEGSSYGLDRNCFVHTGDWHSFTNIDPVYPISYSIITEILRYFMFDSIKVVEKISHEETIGCMNDFCENKKDVMIKLRTADICQGCLNILNKKKVDPFFIDQALRIINAIRVRLLNAQQFFNSFNKTSRIILNERYDILFEDYGNIKLNLTPLQKTLYFYAIAKTEGFTYDELQNDAVLLKNIYSKFRMYDKTKIDEKINNFINNSDNVKSEISKIKKEIEKKLNNNEELVSVYSIINENNKKILLCSRENIRYRNQDNLQLYDQIFGKVLHPVE